MRSKRSFEKLDDRVMLAGDAFNAIPPDNLAHEAMEAEPQYVVNHPPRLQPGNVPLVGTTAFDGMDRIDVVWQTMPAGDGSEDSFSAEYRQVRSDHWLPVNQFNPPIETTQDRTMHSITITGLDWATAYQYRVHHLRAGAVINTYEGQFRTRLPAGDPRAFSFAAYGDSANREKIDDFNSVQAEINRQDLDFSVLLGDNFYTFGTHSDADGRFDPKYSPEAVEWTSQKVDYFGIGNHDVFVDNGQASRDLYSVPMPEAGVTSPIGLPAGEYLEHSFSFDYGDVHFVTIDTNPVDIFFDPDERADRLDALVDYAVVDFEASDARWKIVYAHHPFIGTEKNQLPDDYYFQRMVRGLNHAGVDLFLVGHSHSFSWTYPIVGSADDDNDGFVEFDEVEVVDASTHRFDKGSGIIQVVSGVGGNSLRHTTYDQPVFAQGYSLNETTPDSDYGFARIDVTPRSLTVSYVSAKSGEIVGDTNANGIRDIDEPSFGQFTIADSSVPNADVNGDSVIDDVDLDLLAAAVRESSVETRFDLNDDQNVNQHDFTYLLENHLGTVPGDANLDGYFDSKDLVMVFVAAEFQDETEGNSGWSEGDWNADGDFTSADLVLAFQKGSYVAAADNRNRVDRIFVDWPI